MDEIRYVLALVLIILMPMVISFWIVIHVGSSFWKKRSPYVAYSSALIVMMLVGYLTYQYRTLLIGEDWGFSWVSFGPGLIIYLASLRLAAPVRRYLSFKTFAGVPEVADQPTSLLVEGPYAAVRHPRYFMVLVGIVGWALMANHGATYGVAIICSLGMLLVVHFEERELRQRFGKDYEDYAQRVPQLIPKSGSLRSFL